MLALVPVLAELVTSFKLKVIVPIPLNKFVQLVFCEPIVPALLPEVPPLLEPVNSTSPPALKNPLACASLLNVNVNTCVISGVPELPHAVVLELVPAESVVKHLKMLPKPVPRPVSFCNLVKHCWH